MEYVIHLVVMIGIYSILNQGLNLLMGFTGIISIMQASFFGIGAYISALAALRMGIPFPAALGLAMIGAGLAGFLIGRIITVLKGDYLALVTFGIAVIFYDIFTNWLAVTKGPMGLPGIPQPFDTRIKWMLFVIALTIFSVVFMKLIASSPFGRLLKAIRDDEELAMVMGREVRSVKAIVFMIGAALAGIAGSAYAHYITFIDPTSFTIMESITILAMVIIGGMASVGGGILGASFLILLPEVLRFAGLPASVAASLRQVLFGLLIVLTMFYRPHGLIGKYRLYS